MAQVSELVSVTSAVYLASSRGLAERRRLKKGKRIRDRAFLSLALLCEGKFLVSLSRREFNQPSAGANSSWPDVNLSLASVLATQACCCSSLLKEPLLKTT